MDKEFPDEYKSLFNFGMKRLKRCHTIKLHAIKFCKRSQHVAGANQIEIKEERDKLKKSIGLNQQRILA